MRDSVIQVELREKVQALKAKPTSPTIIAAKKETVCLQLDGARVYRIIESNGIANEQYGSGNQVRCANIAQPIICVTPKLCDITLILRSVGSTRQCRLRSAAWGVTDSDTGKKFI